MDGKRIRRVERRDRQIHGAEKTAGYEVYIREMIELSNKLGQVVPLESRRGRAQRSCKSEARFSGAQNSPQSARLFGKNI